MGHGADSGGVDCGEPAPTEHVRPGAAELMEEELVGITAQAVVSAAQPMAQAGEQRRRSSRHQPQEQRPKAQQRATETQLTQPAGAAAMDAQLPDVQPATAEQAQEQHDLGDSGAFPRSMQATAPLAPHGRKKEKAVSDGRLRPGNLRGPPMDPGHRAGCLAAEAQQENEAAVGPRRGRLSGARIEAGFAGAEGQ